VWIPVTVALMKCGVRWQIEGMEQTRRLFRQAKQASDAPLLVCANHLTMADSFLVSLSLASPWSLTVHYSWLPWNTPEKHRFASTWWKRMFAYLMKCIPVERGGNRQEVGRTLARVAHLLLQRDVALIFPEGGRSRTGRVDTEAVTYGVGRIVRQLPGCRVLAVYLRGEGQTEYTNLPARGERFRVEAELFEPKSDHRGLRGSVDLGRQILMRLDAMERRFFDARK